MEVNWLQRSLLILVFIIVIGIPIYRFIKGVIIGLKDVSNNPDKDEKAKNTKLWEELFKKDWGFKVVEGDMDGYPDLDIYLKFKTNLVSKEEVELKKIFEKWYEKGSKEINKEGSEFGGLMHWMHDEPKIEGKYAYFGFDLGTVSPEKSFTNLVEILGNWNKGKIEKISFGRDQEMVDNLFPEK